MEMMVCRINLWRVRIIPKQAQNGIKVHRTVKIPMEAEEFLRIGNMNPVRSWRLDLCGWIEVCFLDAFLKTIVVMTVVYSFYDWF